jgi:hypothetical protein
MPASRQPFIRQFDQRDGAMGHLKSILDAGMRLRVYFAIKVSAKAQRERRPVLTQYD